MKFILFRHGHSLANQESRIVSSLENGARTSGGPLGTGFGLSDRGKQEVASSARSLSNFILESTKAGQKAKIKILTSPFQRTIQTASIILRELQTTFKKSKEAGSPETTRMIVMENKDEPELCMDLRERFFGEFEMKTPSDELYARVWREDAFNPFHERYGVESVVSVTKRMTDVIRDHECKEMKNREVSSPLSSLPDEQEQEHGETWIVLVSHGDSLQILQAAMHGLSGDRHRQLDHLDTACWRDVQWCEALAEAHHR
ncbi:hypothetical protein BX616_004204 [Lobosporangium transversale]|uniref:Histidine phosphatase superfamily n=1 Tax=Lobosporangium transversale TaxID=64571 RepID=A0A1Y2GK91_9FUNG|nr:histidine phosphatase superfamily [Lobosporangium transversale]KAF9918932.1 hypothetical protein BX616_004204 [Lobosporangium transversale]ORZ13335.1 histidine phosphatase superfamily [Lobosporangium transversale]|eukprot:XP_021880416.1 histidine phosphatase superfamily [Lobosporangium transversale]